MRGILTVLTHHTRTKQQLNCNWSLGMYDCENTDLERLVQEYRDASIGDMRPVYQCNLTKVREILDGVGGDTNNRETILVHKILECARGEYEVYNNIK